MKSIDPSGLTEPGAWSDLLARVRVLPLVVADEPTCAGPLADVLIRGGLHVAEVALRTPVALEVLGTLAHAPNLIVGAGTVTSVDEVDRAADFGASFVVSPGLSPAVAERSTERGLPYLPGVSTATEVMRALELGLTTLKVFPVEVSGGLRLVRALAACFPGVGFVPTGGITASSAGDYLREPAVLAVGGSWMVPRELLAQGVFGEVQALVASAGRLAGSSEATGRRTE